MAGEFAQALATGCFAGLVAIGATAAIERFGGRVGGVLGYVRYVCVAED